MCPADHTSGDQVSNRISLIQWPSDQEALAAVLAELGVADPGVASHLISELSDRGPEDPALKHRLRTRVWHSADGWLTFAIPGFENPEDATELRPRLTGIVCSPERLIVIGTAELEESLPAGDHAPLAKCLYRVIDHELDSVHDHLFWIFDRIDEIEESFATDRWIRPAVGRHELAELRRSVTHTRCAAAPAAAVIANVLDELPDDAERGSWAAEAERLLERAQRTADHLDEIVEAAAGSVSHLLDLSLARTGFLLTAAAAIFLPITLVTGFFGMGFGWLTRSIDSPAHFWLLGVASLVLMTLTSIAVAHLLDRPRARRR